MLFYVNIEWIYYWVLLNEKYFKDCLVFIHNTISISSYNTHKQKFWCSKQFRDLKRFFKKALRLKSLIATEIE